MTSGVDVNNSEEPTQNGKEDANTHGTKVGNTPNFPALRERLLPPLDLASSALLEDLQARGLLEQTLLVWTGEFGRSPRIGFPTPQVCARSGPRESETGSLPPGSTLDSAPGPRVT